MTRSHFWCVAGGGVKPCLCFPGRLQSLLEDAASEPQLSDRRGEEGSDQGWTCCWRRHRPFPTESHEAFWAVTAQGAGGSISAPSSFHLLTCCGSRGCLQPGKELALLEDRRGSQITATLAIPGCTASPARATRLPVAVCERKEPQLAFCRRAAQARALWLRIRPLLLPRVTGSACLVQVSRKQLKEGFHGAWQASALPATSSWGRA